MDKAKLTKLWQVRDYEGVLENLLTGDGFVYLTGELLCEIALDLQVNCPPAIKKKYPLSLLRLAYVLFVTEKGEASRQLMAEIVDYIDSGDWSAEEKQQLRGEWTFIKAHGHHPHILDMLAQLEKTRALTNRVTVLDAREPFLFAVTAPFAVYHQTPGQAEAEGEAFARFAALYDELTGGGGRGAAALYAAGLAYYRGDFKGAKEQSNRAYFLAESTGQLHLQMGASLYLAEIGMHKMDMEGFEEALALMESAAGSYPEYTDMMKQSLEYNRIDLYFEINVTDHTPAWVSERDYDERASIIHGFFPYQSLRYFFYIGQDEEVVAQGELLLQRPKWGALLKGVIGMYVAVSQLRLGQLEEGMTLFKTSFAPLFADGLYLAFSYFYELMDGVLDDYLRSEYPADAEKVFGQMERNRRGRLAFMSTYQGTGALTDREQQIAQLAAQGLQNKEISEKLNLSVNTVRAHLRKIFDKLNIDRRSEIVKRLK